MPVTTRSAKKKTHPGQRRRARSPLPIIAGRKHKTTFHNLDDDLVCLSLSFLGTGHYRYGPLACERLLKCYLAANGDGITTGDSVTSSISCAQQYLEEEVYMDDDPEFLEYDRGELLFFWYSAARYGRVDVMKWAHQQGYSRVWENTDYLFMGEFEGCHDHNICKQAAKYGQLDALRCLIAIGCGWDEEICCAAAEYGHLSILKWARENGCDWDYRTCSSAAGGGHLNILQWARENMCDWNDDTCSSAAGGGHLNILQWARENGCDWDRRTCSSAAKSGHLNILQWARENGCPWDKRTYASAQYSGNSEVLKYVIDQGCPSDN